MILVKTAKQEIPLTNDGFHITYTNSHKLYMIEGVRTLVAELQSNFRPTLGP